MILYAKGDPLEAIQTLLPWVQQVHIKDARKTKVIGTWGTETPVGEGDVPWREFLEIVPDNVNLVIEREGGSNRVNDINQAKQLLTELTVC
jgi:sugar phosphate isomerase/epimerase